MLRLRCILLPYTSYDFMLLPMLLLTYLCDMFASAHHSHRIRKSVTQSQRLNANESHRSVTHHHTIIRTLSGVASHIYESIKSFLSINELPTHNIAICCTSYHSASKRIPCQQIHYAHHEAEFVVPKFPHLIFRYV